MEKKRSYSQTELNNIVLDLLSEHFPEGFKTSSEGIGKLLTLVVRVIPFSASDLTATIPASREPRCYNDLRWSIKSLYEKGYLTRSKYIGDSAYTYYVCSN